MYRPLYQAQSSSGRQFCFVPFCTSQNQEAHQKCKRWHQGWPVMFEEVVLCIVVPNAERRSSRAMKLMRIDSTLPVKSLVRGVSANISQKSTRNV